MATQVKKSLNIIRFALLGWTLAAGVAAWVVAQGEGLAPDIFQGIELYVWGGLLFGFLSLFGGVLVLRMRWKAAEELSEKRTTNIMGWALAEGATVLGIVYLVLVGDATFFSLGIVFQGLTSFVLLPVPGR